jgi:hypothetical protein
MMCHLLFVFESALSIPIAVPQIAVGINREIKKGYHVVIQSVTESESRGGTRTGLRRSVKNLNTKSDLSDEKTNSDAASKGRCSVENFNSHC